MRAVGEQPPGSGARATTSGRAIREAVEHVLPRDLAGRVVERALASAQTATVPSEAELLRLFVREHLVPACTIDAGDAAASALVAVLDPMLDALAAIESARGDRSPGAN
jgi:hypothetical protein